VKHKSGRQCTFEIAFWRVCLSVINLTATSLTLIVRREMLGLQLIWTGCGWKRPYLYLIYCHGMCLEKGTKNISQGSPYTGRNFGYSPRNFTDSANCTLTEAYSTLTEVFLNLTEVFLTLTEVVPCFFLSCKSNARVKLAKTGHGPYSSTLGCICVIRLLFVLFYVLFVCKCLLPPGDNPIAVNKYIIS